MNTNTDLVNQNCELSKKIADLKNSFYSSNKKPVLFKNSIKSQVSSVICSTLGLGELLNSSIFIIPDTNKIFFDYTIFKNYATQEIYEIIVNFLIDKIKICIHVYGNYEVLVNLDTFTVSACHRYEKIIQLFCNSCINSTNGLAQGYSNELVTLYIYNTPNMFQQISKILKPFVYPTVFEKLVLKNKSESVGDMQYIYDKKVYMNK
jgi:hypothetical protein